MALKGNNSSQFYSLGRNENLYPLGQHLANNFPKKYVFKNTFKKIIYIRHNTFHIYLFLYDFKCINVCC